VRSRTKVDARQGHDRIICLHPQAYPCRHGICFEAKAVTRRAAIGMTGVGGSAPHVLGGRCASPPIAQRTGTCPLHAMSQPIWSPS
jgi:hypothetical protein